MNKYNVPKKEYKNIRKGLKEQSGSSSSGGDSENSAEYYKILNKNVGDITTIITYGVVGVKMVVSSASVIMGSFLTIDDANSLYFDYNIISIKEAMNNITGFRFNGNTFKEIVIEFMMASSDADGDYATIEEATEMFNSSFTPITKEEFYDLNNI